MDGLLQLRVVCYLLLMSRHSEGEMLIEVCILGG